MICIFSRDYYYY